MYQTDTTVRARAPPETKGVMMMAQFGNATSDANCFIISGGNAYGVTVSDKCRGSYNRDAEQASVDAWNVVMAAEAVMRESIGQDDITSQVISEERR